MQNYDWELLAFVSSVLSSFELIAVVKVDAAEALHHKAMVAAVRMVVDTERSKIAAR